MKNRSLYYTWKNIKKSYKNNKFKIWAPIWNEKFELFKGSFSRSDIQDYFQYILKKHGEKDSKLNENYKLLEKEDKINVALVINQSIKMTRYSVQPRDNICKRLWIFYLKYGKKYK